MCRGQHKQVVTAGHLSPLAQSRRQQVPDSGRRVNGQPALADRWLLLTFDGDAHHAHAVVRVHDELLARLGLADMVIAAGHDRYLLAGGRGEARATQPRLAPALICAAGGPDLAEDVDAPEVLNPHFHGGAGILPLEGLTDE